MFKTKAQSRSKQRWDTSVSGKRVDRISWNPDTSILLRTSGQARNWHHKNSIQVQKLLCLWILSCRFWYHRPYKVQERYTSTHKPNALKSRHHNRSSAMPSHPNPVSKLAVTTGGNSLDIKVLEGPSNKLGWEVQVEGETHDPVASIDRINQHQLPCHFVSRPLSVTEGWALLLHYVGALTLIFTICGAPWRDWGLPEGVKVHSRHPLHLQDMKEGKPACIPT